MVRWFCFENFFLMSPMHGQCQIQLFCLWSGKCEHVTRMLQSVALLQCAASSGHDSQRPSQCFESVAVGGNKISNVGVLQSAQFHKSNSPSYKKDKFPLLSAPILQGLPLLLQLTMGRQPKYVEGITSSLVQKSGKGPGHTCNNSHMCCVSNLHLEQTNHISSLPITNFLISEGGRLIPRPFKMGTRLADFWNCTKNRTPGHVLSNCV